VASFWIASSEVENVVSWTSTPYSLPNCFRMRGQT